MTRQGLTEEFYAHVDDVHGYDYTPAERLAIAFAERFAVDHRSLDDEFFAELRRHFTDPEILDLAICCAHFLGTGRLLRAFGIDETCLLDVGEGSPVPQDGEGSPVPQDGEGGPAPHNGEGNPARRKV